MSAPIRPGSSAFAAGAAREANRHYRCDRPEGVWIYRSPVRDEAGRLVCPECGEPV